ncbi:MAG: MFS transporter [Ruminiclostridium sp.]|nr:MFS transporter [Ruminiclostridium sp.]
MNIRNNYKHTIAACYIGYIAQAIVNNFIPLLFITFHNIYDISLEKIGLLVTVNFTTQLIVDIISAKLADKIGYRPLVVAAHIFATIGLISLAFLPDILPNPYIGLCFSIILYAIGGGLTEVIISPIVEACPTEGKSAAMSLLHSFYCWGSVLVVVGTTLFFNIFGTEMWRIIACIWAIIPLFNIFYFCFVPINPLNEEGDGMGVRQLVKTSTFRIFVLFIFCAGASELAMSQWASAFAETGLNVSKTTGDLLGPCFFAILMGTSRIVHAKFGERISLEKYLSGSAALCVLSYLIASLSPIPVISLIGCGICGFSVGAMWPGTYSLASERCPKGGTTMFALLALAGDAGCSSGPAIVGFVSSALNDDLKLGLLSAIAFPLILLIGLLLTRKRTE